MRAPTAAATPLVVLPLMLPMTHGVALSRMFATRQASLDQRGPARMIRGAPSAAGLEAGKREGGKISRRNTESFGPLALLDVCYMADDCTPGLYVVSKLTCLLRSVVVNQTVRESSNISTATALGARSRVPSHLQVRGVSRMAVAW